MDLITAEHVRTLSKADQGSALVVVEGQAQVLPGPVTDADGYLVIGREDLTGLIGTQPLDESALRELAQRLNSAIVEQGG